METMFSEAFKKTKQKKNLKMTQSTLPDVSAVELPKINSEQILCDVHMHRVRQQASLTSPFTF